jgi:regulator of protease activity HflC (stomatin/prohibitin superfamily)
MNSKRSTVTVESPAASVSGFLALAIGLVLAAVGAYTFTTASRGAAQVLWAIPMCAIGLFALRGLYTLQPGQAVLLTLFGNYRGTDRTSGLRWANPFCSRTRVSVRAHNLNSEKIKVNDKRGNPIEIAAAVVWRVEDTAHATFDVENYIEYVKVQSEAAIRHLASSYAYDDGEEIAGGKQELTLRGGTQEVSLALVRELEERLKPAGILIEDAKISHLAYAPEIAGAMLRRQQAEAVIAARQKIVLGAVTMVEMALKGLSERQVVELDDERKAAMVSNLMVVLCGEGDVRPVINTGTLYG